MNITGKNKELYNIKKNEDILGMLHIQHIMLWSWSWYYLDRYSA